jgi:hypothetical protein
MGGEKEKIGRRKKEKKEKNRRSDRRRREFSRILFVFNDTASVEGPRARS